MEFKEYEVTITETWRKTVRVLAISPETARDLVSEKFNKSEIECEEKDFAGTEFTVSKGRILTADRLTELFLGPAWLVPDCEQEVCV